MQFSYAEVASQLQQLPVAFSTSESHGVLSGLLISSSVLNSDVIAMHLFTENDLAASLSEAQQDCLNDWMAAILESLQDHDLRFALLIPDEQTALPERLAAVAQWCQGFLYGLAAVGETDFETLPNEAAETLSDLSEISKMDFDSIDDVDEAEADLFEITEYVRMAALSLFDDIGAQKKVRATQNAIEGMH